MKIKLIGSLVAILLILIGAAYLIFTYPYSSGTRSGRLVKLSKKGIIYPTYEGILDLGSGDKLTWEFSVHDKKIGEKLISHSGKKVKLEYDELFYRLIFGTKYNVRAFSVIPEVGQTYEEDKRFCRLVQVMRRSLTVVNEIRENINKYDPTLLTEVRDCQR